MRVFKTEPNLTWGNFYRAKIVAFIEDDTRKLYILKDRNRVFDAAKYLAYSDIPKGFFKERKALKSWTISKDKNCVYVYVDGQLFRKYLMERSSETIETEVE